MKYVRIVGTPGIIAEEKQSFSSYNESKDGILNKFYGEGGSLEWGLQKYFGFQTETIIFTLLDRFPNQQYLISQDYLASFDVILVNSFNFLVENQKLLSELKKTAIVLVWDGIYQNLSSFKNSFHIVLTCSHGIVEKYKSLNIDARFLPFSYDNRLDDILDVEKAKVTYENCAFIGGINLGKQSHFERINTISAVKEDVDLYLKLGKKRLLKNLYLLSKNPVLALRYLQISKRNRFPVFGLDYHRKILEYRAVINSHLDGITTPSNIRLFEVTGLGRVLITDRLKGLDRLFEEDREILAYSSDHELKQKIKIVKNDQAFAEFLGRNARKKTSKFYGIENRVNKLVKIINES